MESRSVKRVGYLRGRHLQRWKADKPVSSPATCSLIERNDMTAINTTRIKNNAGDYIVLVDYGSEGMSVQSQHEDANDAVEAMAADQTASPLALVKLCRVSIVDTE